MKKIHYITGKVFWAKVFEPVPNYDEIDHWAFDLELDNAGIEKLASLDLGRKIKSRKDEPAIQYIQFSRFAKKQRGDEEGEDNQPINVTLNGEDWVDGTLIGNGSEGKVKFSIYVSTYKSKKFTQPAVLELDITNLVEYKKKDFKKKTVKPKVNKEEDWTDNNEESTDE